MKRLEFFYDLNSPYSYLAQTQLGRLREETGAELVLKPMLLGAVHKESGARPATEVPAKERYMWRDLRLWADHYGVPMRSPDPFPFRTLKTMRAAVWSRERGGPSALEAFTREAFKLYWEEGGAPKGMTEADEDAALSEVARRIGQEPRQLLEGAAAAEVKEALKAATTEALERGVFGAPTFFVNGEEMYWGNDRLHFAEAALRKIDRSGRQRADSRGNPALPR